MNHILSRFWRRFSTYFHEPHSFAYKKPIWFTYHTWTAKSFGFPTKLFLLWWPKWKWYFFSLKRTPPNVLSPFLQRCGVSLVSWYAVCFLQRGGVSLVSSAIIYNIVKVKVSRWPVWPVDPLSRRPVDPVCFLQQGGVSLASSTIIYNIVKVKVSRWAVDPFDPFDLFDPSPRWPFRKRTSQ